MEASSSQELNHQQASSSQPLLHLENANSQQVFYSNSEQTNLLLPFSGNLQVDQKLNLSNKNFKECLRESLKNKLSNDYLFTNCVPTYPTPYIFAKFAETVYKETENGCDFKNRPPDWKLLTTAFNNAKANCYFGAAYFNPESQQVVVAHRGTCPTNIIATFWTDIVGITYNNYVGQVDSAVTFAYRISSAIDELNKDTGSTLQLSFTGHSLGGWLAQITCFTSKYLYRKENNFVRIPVNAKENDQTHTVVFDSPGCKTMLLELKKSFDLLYSSSTSLTALDITSYLSAPNRINTCNLHLGSIYRIFIDLSDMSFWDVNTPIYNLFMHSIKKILHVFDPETGQVRKDENGNLKIETVVDWPLNEGLFRTGEYKYFFVWASQYNDYDPKRKATEFQAEIRKKLGYNPIRYQTKPFDEEERSMSVFTQSEQQFLERYMLLRQLPKFRQLDSLFDSIGNGDIENGQVKKNARERLKDFQIENGNVSCQTVEEEFIPFVKRLLQSFPEIKVATKKALFTFEIRKQVYHFESSTFLREVERFPLNFKDVVGLKEFLLNDQERVWLLVAQLETRLTLAKIYKIFQSIKSTTKYSNDDNYIVLEFARILVVDQLVSLKDFFGSEEMIDNLLIIELKLNSDSEHCEAAQKIFKILLDIVQRSSKLKIILIVQQGDELATYFQKESSEVLGQAFIETEDKQNVWGDLTLDSQKELLAKKGINFLGHKNKTSLGELLGICNLNDESTEKLEDLNKIIDSKTLIELINDNGVNIGSKLLQLSDLEVTYAKLYEDIPASNLADALLKTSDESNIFMISGSSSLDELLQQLNIREDSSKNELKNAIDNKKIVLSLERDNENNSDRFKQLCYKNKDKSIHWVEVTSCGFRWQQLYDHSFYIKRQFNYQQEIVLKQEIKKQVLQENSSDCFVFNDIVDKQVLMNLLGVSKEHEKKKFLENLDNETIRLTSEEGANEIFRELSTKDKSVHWLKVERIRNNKKFIWYRSHGSLDGLRDLIDSDNSTVLPLDEKKFIEVKGKDRVVIIADEPGMGKSTTLTSLSEQIKSGWVLRIDLKDCHHAIAKLPSTEVTIEKTVEFLMMVSDKGLNSALGKGLLRYGLEGELSKPMFLLFDGFDEIKEEPQNGRITKDTEEESKTTHQVKVIRLLQFLQERTIANIWITTRKYPRKFLENSLSTFSTKFKKLESLQQEEFLKKFWQVRLTLKLSQFGDQKEKNSADYAKHLLKEAKNILGQDISNFMGIPLQMRMLAEVFQRKLELLTKSESNDFNIKPCSVLDLYQSFIEAKYDIYLKDKMGLSSTATKISKKWLAVALTKKHRNLAFHLLFPNEANKFLENKFLLINESSEVEDEEMELNRAGLIQSIHGDGKFEFIHRSFAEYFTADLLAHWLGNSKGRHPKYPPLEDFLVNNVLFKPKNNVIRLFLSSQLAKLPNNAFIFYEHKIAQLWLDKQERLFNEENQTVFHVLAKENHAKLVHILLGSFRTNPEELIHFVSARDINDETALYLAAKENHDQVVDQFFNSVIDCSTTIKKNLLLATMFRRLKEEHVRVINGMLKDRMEMDTEMKDIVGEIQQDWTLIEPFLRAAMNGGIDEIKKILNEVRDANTKEYLLLSRYENKTALHLAAQYGSFDVVEYLLEQGADVNIRDKNSEGRYNLTPLHYASKNGHKDIVTILLKNNAEINVGDRNGTTPLQHVAKTGKLDIARILIEQDADTNVADNNGMTALSWAAKGGHQKIVKLLMDTGKIKVDINSVDKYGITPLHHAAKSGKWNVVNYLIGQGADVNAADKNGMAPISRIAKASKWDIVKYMVEKGAEVTSLTNDQKVRLLDLTT